MQTAARERMQSHFSGIQIHEVKGRAIDELRAVAGLLDAKAPADATGFKAWLREVARKAAEAGTEGGFLGFGGVTVSEAEKATLAEIDAALGMGSGITPRSA